ncbi:NAD(P)/FAD-dependent oxidoreductase [Rhodobacteraceae bacterium CCMM004]|nr:NAD(P)/FAD-dependent oxidoreductase [Rhodobacteraceae bacterium CCMM004]
MTDDTSLDPDLGALEARVARDLEDLCRPAADWVAKRSHEGRPVTDVVIVGGGMCGALAWHALAVHGIRDVRVFDRAEEGREGPWLTYARMETLRSPKHLTGPAFGMGALTFRAWFRAQFGEDAWEALDKIPRPMWMDYLMWYRRVLGVPVENGVAVERIAPAGPYLRLTLSGPGAPSDEIICRKLVMATGRDGTGGPNIPDFVGDLPRSRWAHSADDIDFAALKGRRVVVIGVGASAMDNAAEALEQGAAEVRFLVRRKEMPRINKMMGIGSPGFSCGYGALPDEWRWRFMRYSFVTQTPPPRGSTQRVSRHPNAYFHFGKGIAGLEPRGEGVRVRLSDGSALDTDFVVLGTGFTVDPMARTEFGPAADDIELWTHAYTPPPDERHADLANFPYLNRDFTFRPRRGRDADWLGHVYCYNYGATASQGKISGDIPGISTGATILAQALAARFYSEDVERHWQNLVDYDTPEILGDEYRDDPWPAAAEAETEVGR